MSPSVQPDPVNIFSAPLHLTPQQQRVVHHGNEHARVMAVAGSGKTTTLVHRVLFLLSQGYEPRRVLVLMYNRSARVDFEAKLQREYQRQQVHYPKPDIRTFHSIGHKLCESMVRWGVLQPRQLVREGWPYEKLVRQGINQALPNADQATRRKALDKDHLEAFMQFAERVKADLETPKDQFRLLGLPDDQRYFIEAFEQLEQIMAREGVMTFSDLLYRPAMAILAQPELETRISNHLDHVIVDEYQDINSIQQFLLSILAGERARVMVVGDVDQCIYEWRGARPEFMLRDFALQFQQPVSYPLSYSFRYGATLALAANHLIGRNKNRDAGLCLATPDHADTQVQVLPELNQLVSQIQPVLEQSGAANIAVLVRSWALSVPVQLVFLQQQIPFRLHQQGHFVFNQPLVGQFLAYLQLAAGEANAEIGGEALGQMLSFPPLFLSQGEQQGIQQQVQHHGLSPDSIISGMDLKPYTAKRLKKRLELLLELQRQPADQPVGPLAIRVLQETDAYDLIDKAAATKDQAQERKQTLQALVNYIRQQRMSVSQLLNHIEQQKQSGASQSHHDDVITITTVHGAKGLEWPHVILAGLTEGSFPCYQNITDFDEKAEEGERRLFYVAMTRARETLWLLTDHGLSEERKKRPSRFVAEMNLDDCRMVADRLKADGSENRELMVENVSLIRQYLSASGLEGIQVGSRPVEKKKRPAKAKRLASKASHTTFYRIGDLIEHEVFGRGELTHIEPGAQTRITVRFDQGSKVLLAERAPIKRLAG
ncbi:ATP-dependent helicase [Oceanospirillum sanctuarii]|uniref:ATP-dependent helicase n=1 Tax=Oceanospirillum sanctuarii TaxID=1434821 RepID=UPI00112285C2|nr:ATP-dependent helicase [Oceanospirillum sanctuarii]